MKTRIVKVVMNAGRKPVHVITDRAKRYRAHATENRPPAPKRCGFCGGSRNIDIDHIYGDESDGAPDNLMWLCRGCNTAKAARMRAVGIGKLTRQYNPKKGGGGSRTAQLAAYGAAIKVMRGQFEGDIGKALQTIRSTSPDLRSAYTARTWPIRRQVYGRSGRQGGLFDEVPF